MTKNLQRGLGWLAVAAIGFFVLGYLPQIGVPEYTARALGSLFKIAAVVFGSYRVSRDVFKIDPGQTADPTAFALLQLSRALLCGLFAVAVCVSV